VVSWSSFQFSEEERIKGPKYSNDSQTSYSTVAVRQAKVESERRVAGQQRFRRELGCFNQAPDYGTVRLLTVKYLTYLSYRNLYLTV
jgi:hypothetical protein